MQISNHKFYVGALIVSLFLAGAISSYASSSPDGLEKVAEDVGFIESATEHSLANSTLADYGIKGVENARISVGFAGIIGVLVAVLRLRLVRQTDQTDMRNCPKTPPPDSGAFL
jgi:hypothetical protein